MITRSEALNVFRPNAATEDPEVFAGRRQYVLDLTDALLVENSVPIIYGERGLGKTSLALQIARIALGDVTLLEEYGRKSRTLTEAEQFTVFWMSCSDAATRTCAEVLQRLINTAEGYSSLSQLQERLVTVESKTKLTFKVLERETSRRYDSGSVGRFSELHVEDKVVATLDALRNAGHERLLFVIDELDRVRSTDGLANFLKNTSTAATKFLLVGIGQSISTLLADHESLARSVVPVKVEVMSLDEVDAIIRKASSRIRRSGLRANFTVGARRRIAEAAAGFPWFVHVLGQSALMTALDSGSEQIAAFHVEAAINSLASNRFAQHFNDLYQRAVGDSTQREVVLRLFSKWDAEDIPVSEIYPVALKLGVSNPAACRSQLFREQNGQVLVAPPGQSGLVRFRNAMFKRYCTLRGSVFEGNVAAVEDGWAKRHLA